MFFMFTPFYEMDVANISCRGDYPTLQAPPFYSAVAGIDSRANAD